MQNAFILVEVDIWSSFINPIFVFANTRVILQLPYLDSLFLMCF